MEYVIMESSIREDLRPFGGCFRVLRKNNRHIWVEIDRGEEKEERRYPIGWVRFYSPIDITEVIEAKNKEVEKSRIAHENLVRTVIKSVRDSVASFPKREPTQ